MSPSPCRPCHLLARALLLALVLAPAAVRATPEAVPPDPERKAPPAVSAPLGPFVPGRPATRSFPSSPGPPRGMWVLCEGAQRVLEHRERLDWLIADARALGVTDLFVQVYRGGRAWFASSHADTTPYEATWRGAVTADGTTADALTTLIEHAHAAGIRVHAWVNVLSLSKNPDAPILHRLGRDAVVSDQWGRSLLDYPGFEVPDPDRRYYRMGTPGVYLDPGAPGVREALGATFDELVERYPGLDGLHLDYIRYPDVLPFTPGTRFGVGLSFGFGEATRERFRQETGLVAPHGDALGNGNRFDDWRREQVTSLVTRIANGARAKRAGLRVSAAVWAYPDRAYLAIFQDWRGWLDEGLVDFAMPMLYSTDDRLFRYRLLEFAGAPWAKRLWIGLGSWLFARSPERAVAQRDAVLAQAGPGLAYFSWDSIRQAPALLEALRPAPPPAAPPR